MSPKCLSPKRLVSVVAQWSCHPIVRRPWQLSYSSVLVRVLVDIRLMNHWRTKALNAPLFALIQPSLETVDLFSFYHMVWQAVPYIHNSSTDIKTTSEFVVYRHVLDDCDIRHSVWRIFLGLHSLFLLTICMFQWDSLTCLFSSVVRPIRLSRSSYGTDSNPSTNFCPWDARYMIDRQSVAGSSG